MFKNGYKRFIICSSFLLGFLTVYFILSTGCCAAGESAEIVWQKVYNYANNIDRARSVVVDDTGNVYVGGYIYSGNYNCFLVKYDPSGDTIWQRVWDGGTQDLIYGIALDDTGNLYATGFTNSFGTWDFLIIKYNTSGNTEWQKVWNSGNEDRGRCVAVDDTGNVYVAGYSNNGLDFDYLTIKYNTSGNTEWQKVWNGGGNDEAFAITVDKEGYAYVTGYSDDVANMLTVKYASSGDTVWQKKCSNSSSEEFGIAVDNSGYVYAAGIINTAILLVKYNSTNGDTIWQKQYKDEGRITVPGNIFIDKTDNLYITGHSSLTNWDYYTMKLNSNGDVIWQTRYDSGREEKAYSIAIDKSSNVYVTGYSDNGTNHDWLTIKYRQIASAIGLTPPSDQGQVKIGSTGGQGIVYAGKSEQAVIAFKPTAAGKVTVRIYTLNGLLVREKTYDSSGPNDTNNYIQWACDNAEGGQVASGIYLVYVNGPGINLTKKVAILK